LQQDDVSAEQTTNETDWQRLAVAEVDKNKLAEMDRKFQSGEDFTVDEIKFLYGFDRPDGYYSLIHNGEHWATLDKFRGNIRQHIQQVAEQDTDGDIDKFAHKVDRTTLGHNLDEFLSAGARVDSVITRLEFLDINEYLDCLLRHTDIDNIAANVSSICLGTTLDEFLRLGADVDKIVSNLSSFLICSHLDLLLEAGADAQNIISRLNARDAEKNLPRILGK
jgi:hypothetical protein